MSQDKRAVGREELDAAAKSLAAQGKPFDVTNIWEYLAANAATAGSKLDLANIIMSVGGAFLVIALPIILGLVADKYHFPAMLTGALSSVAVFGVGGVGLSAIAAAKVVDADPVIAIDLDDEKLAFARKFGATHGINASKVDPIEAIRDLTRKTDAHGFETFGADFAFDCIGVRKTMEQILPASRNGLLGARTGGTAVLVGVPTTTVELDPRDLLINEKKYIGSIGGSCRPDRDFPMFLRWYAEGDLDLDALVTRRFKIEEINEAVHALESGQIAGRAILEF